MATIAKIATPSDNAQSDALASVQASFDFDMIPDVHVGPWVGAGA